MSWLADWLLIGLDKIVGGLPLSEDTWALIGGFRVSEAALKARKRLNDR